MTDLTDHLATALSDRYRLDRELGRGGMATVHLAHDLKHERKVAVKVLHPHIAAAIGDERFLQEIHVAGQLSHPHILGLIDSGTVELGGRAQTQFYVMPFVEGESLRDRVIRERQLPVADARRIAVEVADALNYAHARNRAPRHQAREHPARGCTCTGSRLRGGQGAGECRGAPADDRGRHARNSRVH